MLLNKDYNIDVEMEPGSVLEDVVVKGFQKPTIQLHMSGANLSSLIVTLGV